MINKILKLSYEFYSKANVLGLGESTMARQKAIEILGNLRGVINNILDMRNNIFEISYKTEVEFLLNFINSALSGKNVASQKQDAKNVISTLGPFLSGFINVQEAIKAIDYYDAGI